jgi:hypothetical protein
MRETTEHDIEAETPLKLIKGQKGRGGRHCRAAHYGAAH